jgi:sigma-B regulation protein RsbU (phosphoserine phosphatase)
MASLRAFLRCRVNQIGNIAEIVTDVNLLLAHDTRDTGQFMTLFYTELDPWTRTLSWVRAGHEPALFYDPSADRFEEFIGTGTALGIDGRIQYQSSERAGLTGGQLLLIGTDGLWETRNSSDEMFGRERLKSIIRAQATLPAEAMLHAILDGLNEFRGSVKQEDDVTLVLVKVC